MANTTNYVTNFSVPSGGVQGTTIVVEFNTLPGNQPNSYGNMVAIWQNQNQVPWAQKPLKTQSIPNNSQAGSVVFSGLDVTTNSYIVGYAVGPKTTNVCSTVFVPAIGSSTADQSFQTSISIATLSSTSLLVSYQTPTGYTPKTNENWLGIWLSSAASYVNQPEWSAPASDDNSAGVAVFNNISFRRGTTYTVAYFMGGYDGSPRDLKAMATTMTFTV
jgi:hypothetical protein